jgi:hypothetical protein
MLPVPVRTRENGSPFPGLFLLAFETQALQLCLTSMLGADKSDEHYSEPELQKLAFEAMLHLMRVEFASQEQVVFGRVDMSTGVPASK